MSNDTTKELGRIASVKFGIDGYQEAMIGLFVTLNFSGGGTQVSECAWDPSIVERSEHAAWTEEERGRKLEGIMRKVSELLKQAKVRDVNALVGIPVEVETRGLEVLSWRILEEVL